MPAPELQATDLDTLVRSVVQLFHGQLTSGVKKIDPVLEMEKLPPVSADPVLIRRVIENLVLNAIDAMPNGGKLTFRTTLGDRFAIFEIADTGTGLTPEECDRIFTPYYTSKQHGTGLGLAIAQSVVSDHHGRISVSSTKNLGTTFRVELPLYSSNGNSSS
jgi:signal transduction histidine kinase